MPRMNTCQEKPLVWGLPLEVASRYFPSRPTSWEVALATSQVLIQEVPSVYDCLSVVYLCHVPLSYYE